jgi:hypothetical protein
LTNYPFNMFLFSLQLRHSMFGFAPVAIIPFPFFALTTDQYTR